MYKKYFNLFLFRLMRTKSDMSMNALRNHKWNREKILRFFIPIDTQSIRTKSTHLSFESNSINLRKKKLKQIYIDSCLLNWAAIEIHTRTHPYVEHKLTIHTIISFCFTFVNRVMATYLDVYIFDIIANAFRREKNEDIFIFTDLEKLSTLLKLNVWQQQRRH